MWQERQDPRLPHTYPYQDIPRRSFLTGRFAKTGHPPSPTRAALKERQQVGGLCWPVSRRGEHTIIVRDTRTETGPCLTERRSQRPRVWSHTEFHRMFPGLESGHGG